MAETKKPKQDVNEVSFLLLISITSPYFLSCLPRLTKQKYGEMFAKRKKILQLKAETDGAGYTFGNLLFFFCKLNVSI